MEDYPFYDKQPGPERREKLNEMYEAWNNAIGNVFKGDSGWSPLLRPVVSGNKTALQLYDWTGGQGVKPTTTGYLGTAGYVANIADAVDFRGPQGLQGPQGSKGDTGAVGPQGIMGASGKDAIVTRTSSSTISISTGSKSFTYTAVDNLGWAIGQRLRASNSTSNWVEGVITSVSQTGVTLSVDLVSGSGSFSSWNISIAGERGQKGATGDQGVIGPQGPAATIAVGTVTTSAPGSSAQITNTGTSGAATFNFTIPRGDVGPQGLKGDTGAAATVSIGTTSTSAPGGSATVSNSGSSSAAVLNFSIPRGEQGPAGTVTVGTVVSGAPGSNAQVTNSGSSQAAVLNFVIPRGDKGDQGAQGPAATIAVGAVATGDAGTSASVTNSGTQNAATFDFIIPRGDKGDQGIQGAKGDTGSKGDKGDKGDAATISVGTVTTGAPWTQVQVVNSGTTSAAVFDFTIPRGADGSGTGDMLKSEYDTVGDGVVNASRSTPWNGVTDKPAVIAAGADQATARLSINAAAADHTHSATDISFTPVGNVVATNVQAAIAELDSDLTTALGDINAALIAING